LGHRLPAGAAEGGLERGVARLGAARVEVPARASSMAALSPENITTGTGGTRSGSHAASRHDWP
jgi:hypothetical protein